MFLVAGVAGVLLTAAGVYLARRRTSSGGGAFDDRARIHAALTAFGADADTVFPERKRRRP